MVDMGMLTQTAEPAKEVLGVEKIDVVADRGYFKIEDIEACEKAGMEPYMPRPHRGPSVQAGFYRKDEFKYDARDRPKPRGEQGRWIVATRIFPLSLGSVRSDGR
jgi:hypothetical protein